MPGSVDKWKVFFYSRRDTQSKQDVFDEIWEQYYKRLFFFIRQMVGEYAEDLLQEIMLKVYQNMEKYNPIYSFNTWVYTVARNHCITYLEKKKRVKDSKFEEGMKAGPYLTMDTPENGLMHQELHVEIDNFLEKLEPAYRQMAFLRFYEGFTLKKIAQIVDVPYGTVKSRLHLIRKALKKKLEAYDAI